MEQRASIDINDIKEMLGQKDLVILKLQAALRAAEEKVSALTAAAAPAEPSEAPAVAPALAPVLAAAGRPAKKAD